MDYAGNKGDIHHLYKPVRWHRSSIHKAECDGKEDGILSLFVVSNVSETLMLSQQRASAATLRIVTVAPPHFESKRKVHNILHCR